VLLTSGAILLVVEREQGLLRRLASTPISRRSIVLGKWTARMALALVQIGFAMALGRLLFGMQWGDTIWMVALVLGSLARSQAQAAGIDVLGTMVLAALGGAWWPIEVAPSWMQSVQTRSPAIFQSVDVVRAFCSRGSPMIGRPWKRGHGCPPCSLHCRSTAHSATWLEDVCGMREPNSA
jgi:ABC-type multidrug transport system permease subunit